MALKAYKAVLRPGEGYYEEKRSRFFSFVMPAASEEAVLLQAAALKKKYYDCSHVCYAFRLNTVPLTEKYTDAGEPSGTAGIPMLNVLRGSGALNAAVFVIRYFGGTKLGTGGLSRAYSSAAADAVNDSTILLKQPGGIYTVSCDYSSLGKLQYMLKEEGLPVLETTYTDSVGIRFLLPDEKAAGFMKRSMDAFSGRLAAEKEKEVLFVTDDGKTEIFDD